MQVTNRLFFEYPENQNCYLLYSTIKKGDVVEIKRLLSENPEGLISLHEVIKKSRRQLGPRLCFACRKNIGACYWKLLIRLPSNLYWQA